MSDAPRTAPEIQMRDLVLPNDTNHYGTLFGGVLLSYMDKAAYIAATKFCEHSVVTASVDVVHFHRPIYVGDTVLITAKVVDAGKTSMTVNVRVERESFLRRETVHCCTGAFNMVAVDQGLRPIGIPDLLLDSDEAREEAARARKLRESLKQHKREQQVD